MKNAYPYVAKRYMLNYGVYNSVKKTWFKINMKEKEASVLALQLNRLTWNGTLDPSK